MKIKVLLAFCFLLSISAFSSKAQKNVNKESKFIFEGLVYGYENDQTRKLFKKTKQTLLEGVLEDVQINVYLDKKLQNKTLTNSKGEFKVILDPNSLYRIQVSKKGYDNNILYIDTRGIPFEKSGVFKFTGAEFLLNSYEDSSDPNQSIGTILYNPDSGFMEFELNENKIEKSGFLSKKDNQDNVVELMKRAVLKNKMISESEKLSKPEDKKFYSKDQLTKPVDSSTVAGKVSNNSFSEFKLLSNKILNNPDKPDFKNRILDIRLAREQLERDRALALTKEDSLLIEQREWIINSAESELEAAMVLIKLQKSKLEVQNTALFLSIGSLVLMLGFFSVVFMHYKQKIKMNRLLVKKNKKILDSINYAHRIQQSILLNENEIHKFLPESFIYYRPKDIVSGDFYWFSEIKGKIIIAIVDCTGHGVPGAFMSMIGNTLLNQIVNEKQIIDPASILKELHLGVLKALRQEKHESLSEDGMEMSLCVIDQKSASMEFAGAMNPIYVVNSNQVEVFNADAKSIGGKTLRPGMDNKYEFTTQNIPLSENSSVYMFTDGYMDQFGGINNKKFNTVNFKKLLLEMQHLKMDEQKQLMHKALEDWKKDYQQVDDILVAGYKVRKQ